MVERVLVIPREDVPGGTAFHGLRAADEKTLRQLSAVVAARGAFMERPDAEENPGYKQLIPYVVVRDGDRVFLTERTTMGGDRRLHGKASIGIGGHLNEVDYGPDALARGLRREWSEELETDWEPEFRLVGLLNDDTNPVGTVHLGVVFNVEAGGQAVSVRERDKLVGRWATVPDLHDVWERLETWSQLVAAHLLEL